MKSQLPQYIGESIKRKKSLLTESWSKTKKTIVRRTIEIIKNALPWASTADAQKYLKTIFMEEGLVMSCSDHLNKLSLKY